MSWGDDGSGGRGRESKAKIKTKNEDSPLPASNTNPAFFSPCTHSPSRVVLDSGEMSKNETLPFCSPKPERPDESQFDASPFTLPPLPKTKARTHLIPSNQIPPPKIDLEAHPLIRSLPLRVSQPTLGSRKRLERFLGEPDIERLDQAGRATGSGVEDGGVVRVEFELRGRSVTKTTRVRFGRRKAGNRAKGRKGWKNEPTSPQHHLAL